MIGPRYSFVTVSSKFNSTRERAVQAASWAGVAPGGSVGGLPEFLVGKFVWAF